MKKRVILLIYGSGGHKEQMKRFYSKINNKDSYIFVSISEDKVSFNENIMNYSLLPFRNKYSYIKSFLDLPIFIKQYISILIDINSKYEVIGIISTGPGFIIPISLYYKILNKKIVFIETWSRFETKSFTGSIMYKIADKFYIQNKSLQSVYPNGIYGGLL